MKQIITNLFACLVINIELIWCANTGIEHLLNKEESTIYLPSSVVTLHCPDVISKAKFRWTLNGRSLESYVNINETNGAIQVKVTIEFSGVFICYAIEEIDGQDVTKISSWNLDTARIADWKPIEEVPPQEVDGGDPLKLTCDNKPRSRPVGQYSWYKQDNAEKQVKESQRIAIDKQGSLYFVFTEMEDNLKGDEYKCSISNRMLEEIKLGSPKRFHVKESIVEDKAPSRLYNGTDEYTLIGRTAFLECIFSGFPAPNIVWFDKENKPIIANEKYKIDKWGRTLVIENITEEDEGYYRCMGENKIDTIVSTVYLNVSSKPIFLNHHGINVVNDIMVMNCTTRSAKGESPPDSPVWLENGEYLPKYKLDSGKYELKRGGMELIVYNLTQPDDYRCFQCIVSNSIGFNYVTSCFTSNNNSFDIDTQTTPPKVSQFENASPQPQMTLSPNGLNLGLILGVISGVMVLFVCVGILSLLVFRKRRQKENKVVQRDFYSEVKISESGAGTTLGEDRVITEEMVL